MGLHVKGKPFNIDEPILGRIVLSGSRQLGGSSILLITENEKCPESEPSFIGALIIQGYKKGLPPWLERFPRVEDLPYPGHFEEGEVVLLNPSGLVSTLFRPNSNHNALFVTEQRNSNCIMCPQPPKAIDDIPVRMVTNQKLISLILLQTEHLGITGGEPTLLGPKLAELLAQFMYALPATEINVLTNGRAFAYQDEVRPIALLGYKRLRFAITLHSDYCVLHDYASQVGGAFAQTMTGLHNLPGYGLRVEIRIVLHKISAPRLKRMADFIYRTLPFAEHVALMGLEYTGYAPINDSKVWIEPTAYMAEREQAVEFLSRNRMNVSIHNLPLCLLPQSLWKYARKSISDWKQMYSNECQQCTQKSECGGLFASTARMYVTQLKALV